MRKSVGAACIGKGRCSFKATHTELGVDKPCADFSRLHVQAVCSSPKAAKGYNLKISIPAGATAYVSFPKLGKWHVS